MVLAYRTRRELIRQLKKLRSQFQGDVSGQKTELGEIQAGPELNFPILKCVSRPYIWTEGSRDAHRYSTSPDLLLSGYLSVYMLTGKICHAVINFEEINL